VDEEKNDLVVSQDRLGFLKAGPDREIEGADVGNDFPTGFDQRRVGRNQQRC
jgi:hypothetical protein